MLVGQEVRRVHADGRLQRRVDGAVGLVQHPPDDDVRDDRRDGRDEEQDAEDVPAGDPRRQPGGESEGDDQVERHVEHHEQRRVERDGAEHRVAEQADVVLDARERAFAEHRPVHEADDERRQDRERREDDEPDGVGCREHGAPPRAAARDALGVAGGPARRGRAGHRGRDRGHGRGGWVLDGGHATTSSSFTRSWWRDGADGRHGAGSTRASSPSRGGLAHCEPS